MTRFEPIGRALRFTNAHGQEQWQFTENDQVIVERLRWLGSIHIGGFSDLFHQSQVPGQPTFTLSLIRYPITQSLATWLQHHDGPLPWRKAIHMTIELATMLRECETQQLFPGALTPHNISTSGEEPKLGLRADSLVYQLVGASSEQSKDLHQSISSRWLSPEQAAGQPADHRSNRYVLGLFLYRFLAGEHAFAGQGLRIGLEQAQRGPAPFRDEIASKLPPGLQSFCLRMLAPDPQHRPASAEQIRERLLEFLQPAKTMVAAAHPELMTSKAPVRSSPPAPSSSRPRLTAAPPNPALRWLKIAATLILPVGLGLGTAALVLTNVEPQAKVTTKPKPIAGQHQPLTQATTTAQDCATCHPRQSSEWHRSVMGHSGKSPLFQALEILIEEQAGRSRLCPGGAGILRTADARSACRDPNSGFAITGSGGELWCVNCHTPNENLRKTLPPWDGTSLRSRSRLPLRDLLPASTMEGIGCAFCHQVAGPSRPGNLRKNLYEGNPHWSSTTTGQKFSMRPEDRQGIPGIANSGYFLSANELLADANNPGNNVPGDLHKRPSQSARDYLRSSEFCGACHDVRLFGSDGFGVKKGEHFKRLRNAYSEWVEWAKEEKRAGRTPASCQDCHMSVYPGVCVRSEEAPVKAADIGNFNSAYARGCPPGTRFEERKPGEYPQERIAASSSATKTITTHYFSGVDIPLTPEFSSDLIHQPTVDVHGIPLGAHQRRDLLLGRTFRFTVDNAKLVRGGTRLEIPLVIENVGAGHRVPAGFSQEREFWVHLRVEDKNGELVYEVGRVDRGDEDLHDKIFVRINTDDQFRDNQERPLGLFGADIMAGPDHPEWSPPPARGGTSFRGKGLVNFQNGFLRCVSCIGEIDFFGQCQPKPGQEQILSARYEDGIFDVDTGVCTSNLQGENAYFEVFYPVGSLDASRGLVKGPDAIIDTRSLPPKTPIRYTYELATNKHPGPYTITARLMFRAFPPFLIRAFAEYEKKQADRGLRPSGPLVTENMLERLEAVELIRERVVVQ